MTPLTGPVVVTGASGFIGRHVVASLAAAGIPVRAIVRRQQSLGDGVQVVVAKDVLDAESVFAAVNGASAIVHLAGRAHAKAESRDDPGSECRRVNVDGTAMLLEAAAAAGVRSLVFVSSVKAVASESDVALTPSTPPQPSDSYGESKLEAERLVRVAAVRDGFYAPILRLPVVYGPGVKANMAALFSAVSRGIPLPLASVNNRRSFAYVGNVSAAIQSLIESQATGSQVLYTSDDHDLSTPGLVKEIALALDRSPRLLPMPLAMLRAVGATGGLLSRIAGLHFSSESVTAVLGSLFVDTSSLREMTGFKPPYSVAQGMSLTAAWFRSTRSG
ncbi:MAG: NAD-dependent epimerase/dehydratase family protein [Gemmatimonadaceae bacterium]